MSFVSRGARAAARPLRRSLQHQSRRNAGHEAGHGHGHGHEGARESAMHVEAGSGTESLSRGFYISVALVPFAYLVYSIASSPGDNAVSRMVKSYEDNKRADETKNVIHTTMLEQAAWDRQLFSANARDESGPSLRNPESFNFGSPYNVSAGRDTADLSALAKFYQDEKEEAEQQRIERLKRNKGRSVYD
ncbi:hypothetical protein PV05_05262 [Exophiala xenobiotica]|uniref:NADH-ubiquinone oxidoreductase 17.8 kDa subunit, mitochondrial n=1 Tax=Exophiala xenobiotica TaxID=348802 RepID=A0A0D2F9C4_9EURO|nr:uncharacterized protein PV05_05262 [Exophiala xenobiotica]KIW56614.1 hypothetical protein PV05_05262 [Exophiala xenobiotica]